MTPCDKGPVLVQLLERDGGQFVVLPEGFLPEDIKEVEISRDGHRVILRPIAERASDEDPS